MKDGAFREDPEHILDILRKVAEQYVEDSPEKAAIEYAAKAVHFAYEETTLLRFKTFIRDFGAELSDKQRDYLRNIGLET